MSEWPNRWIMWLPETPDQGVDTSWGSNCHCHCLWFRSVDRVRSGFVMIARAVAFRMVVGRFSRQQRGVGVLAMLDAGLNTTRRVESVCEVSPSAGGLRLGVPCITVGVLIERHCVAEEVEATLWVVSSTRELFSEDQEVEFWPWIVEAMELRPWEESLSPACTETRP